MIVLIVNRYRYYDNATNILIAYARVGTVCPHPYGRAWVLLNICIFEPFFLFQPAILAVRVDCARVASEGRDQHVLFFVVFSMCAPAILEGLRVCTKGVFSTTLPMSVNRHRNGGHVRNRPVFSAIVIVA